MRLSIVLVISLLALVASETNSLAQEEPETSSHRQMSRFLLRSVAETTGCRANSSLCMSDDSPGPDCCHNVCVNVLHDGHNCGKCRKKCKYPQACCGGECVDIHHNKNHCGKCNNRCKKGVACSHGMCGYA